MAASDLLPSLVLTGLGVACMFSAAIFGGTVSVKPGDAGIAGALVNTSLQIGGSVGTTVLSLVFASAVVSFETSQAVSGGLVQEAALHGYTVAFWWASGLFALGFLVAIFVIPKHTASPLAATGPQHQGPAVLAEVGDVVDASL